MRDSYQRHETEQFPAEPVELAKDYVCSQFSTSEAVLEGTRYMVAMQIAREPLVRHVLRQTFQERAKINIKPTKKGKKVRLPFIHRRLENGTIITNLILNVKGSSKSALSFAYFL